MAFVDANTIEYCEPARQCVRQCAENYIALDKTNTQVYACLGEACFQDEDYSGAIEAFQTSLSLEGQVSMRYSPSDAGIQLLDSMFMMKDYNGMMSQIDRYGSLTVGFWLRERLDDSGFLQRAMYAARESNKVDLLIECCQQQIENSQLSEKDLEAIRTLILQLKPRRTWSSIKKCGNFIYVSLLFGLAIQGRLRATRRGNRDLESCILPAIRVLQAREHLQQRVNNRDHSSNFRDFCTVALTKKHFNQTEVWMSRWSTSWKL